MWEDFDSEAGAGGDWDGRIGGIDVEGLGDDGVAEGGFGTVEFEQERRGGEGFGERGAGGHGVEGGGGSDGGSPVVGDETDAVEPAGVGELAEAGESGPNEVGLEDGDSSGLDVVGDEPVGGLGFTGGDGDGGGMLKTVVAVEVIGEEGFFPPHEVEGLEIVGEGDGGVGVVGAVGVDAEGDGGSDGIADGGYDLDVGERVVADFHFDAAVSALDPVLRFGGESGGEIGPILTVERGAVGFDAGAIDGTKELGDGFVEGFGGEVPEGDVEPGGGGRAAAGLPEGGGAGFFPDGGEFVGVATEGGVGVCAGEAFAPTGEAGIG